MFASNQVIGEAYIALQHHYGVSKIDARAALSSVLHERAGGAAERRRRLARSRIRTGCGLLDRLIADEYRRAELGHADARSPMASRPAVRRL